MPPRPLGRPRARLLLAVVDPVRCPVRSRSSYKVLPRSKTSGIGVYVLTSTPPTHAELPDSGLAPGPGPAVGPGSTDEEPTYDLASPKWFNFTGCWLCPWSITRCGLVLSWDSESCCPWAGAGSEKPDRAAPSNVWVEPLPVSGSPSCTPVGEGSSITTAIGTEPDAPDPGSTTNENDPPESKERRSCYLRDYRLCFREARASRTSFLRLPSESPSASPSGIGNGLRLGEALAESTGDLPSGLGGRGTGSGTDPRRKDNRGFSGSTDDDDNDAASNGNVTENDPSPPSSAAAIGSRSVCLAILLRSGADLRWAADRRASPCAASPVRR